MRSGMRWCFWGLAFVLMLAPPSLAQPVVDEGEAVLWTQRLQAIVYNGQMNSRLFSHRWFVRETIADFELDPDQSREFYEYHIGESVVPAITNALGESGSYTFLRFHERDGHRLALFRLVTDSGGLNYHAWYLRSDRRGRVSAWDVEVYLTGERMSDMIRRGWLRHLQREDPDFEDHVDRLELLYTEHFETIGEIDDARDAGRYPQVVGLYESLPEALKEHQVPMRAAIQAYAGLGRAELCQTLTDRFRAVHAELSNVELAFIFTESAAEDYDQAFALIDALDERLGGDTFLFYSRAGVADEMGDYALAQQYLDAGLALDLPFVDDPARLKLVWRSVEYALAAEDWPRVSAMLTEVEMYDMVINDLREIELYAGYVESGAYEQWLAGRKPGEAWGPDGPPPDPQPPVPGPWDKPRPGGAETPDAPEPDAVPGGDEGGPPEAVEEFQTPAKP